MINIMTLSPHIYTVGILLICMFLYERHACLSAAHSMNFSGILI